MPRFISFRLAAAVALVVVLALSATAVAGAKGGGVAAKLRVLTTSGKVLAEEALSTGTASIPTSPKATCFGEGTGGSGRSVTIKGATALGLLAQAAKSDAALRPLLVTDHFSFGLGLCGVGGNVPKSESEGSVSDGQSQEPAGGRQQGEAAPRRRSALVPGDRLPLPRRTGA